MTLEKELKGKTSAYPASKDCIKAGSSTGSLLPSRAGLLNVPSVINLFPSFCYLM